MANEYTRYAENDPRAAGRGIPPDVLKRLMAGEEVPGWTIGRDSKQLYQGGASGDYYYDNPNYKEGPQSFSYKDPSKEWYTTYDKSGNLINEGNGQNKMTAKDYATFAALVAGTYGLNGGLAGMSEAAATGGADAATTAAWQGGAGLGGDTLSAIGANGGMATAASGMSAAELAAAQELAIAEGGAGVNGLTAAQTAAATGGTAATTAAGNGVWDAIKTGAKDVFSSGNRGGGGANWADLLKAGVSIYGVTKASENSSDATKAAEKVANSQLDLNQQALDWYKQVYADQAPDRAQTSALAKSVADAQIRGMNFATDNAMELADYNKSTFRPVEQRIVKDAMAYDTPERRMSAASSAAADIDTSVAAARQAQNRALGRAGIAPGSTKAMALAEDMAVQQGVARGSAQTGAVRNVETMGHARMMDAASLGRNIPSQQATQQQIAMTTGNSAVQNSNSGLNALQSGNSLMSQGYNSATQGNQVAGNLFNSIANGQRLDDNSMLTGIGNIAQFIGQRYGNNP